MLMETEDQKNSNKYVRNQPEPNENVDKKRNGIVSNPYQYNEIRQHEWKI